MKKIIASLVTREKRYAVLENERVVRLEIVQPQQESTVGNIYIGKVTKVMPGMEAVFVEYGADKNGLLHRDELPVFQQDKSKNLPIKGISSYIHQGQKLLVQVSRDESGTKGAKLSAMIELSSPSLVYIYGNDYLGVSKKFTNHRLQSYWRKAASEHKEELEGLIVRTSMENQSEDDFLKQLHALRAAYQNLVKRADLAKKPGLVYARDSFLDMLTVKIASTQFGEIILDDFESCQELKKRLDEQNSEWTVTYDSGPGDLFAKYHIQTQVSESLKKQVPLPNGGSLIIEETEAFTIIDVNTGKFIGKAQKEQTLFETNLEAASEVVHQIILRNLAGIILVDFINMTEEKHRKAIVAAMTKEMKQDNRHVQIVGFTELGILQLTRKRTAPSLQDKLTNQCTVCQGTGRVDSPETVAFRLERELFEHRRSVDEAVWVEMNQAVADVLLGVKDSGREWIEALIGKKLLVTYIEGQLNSYTIKRFGSYKELKQAKSMYE